MWMKIHRYEKKWNEKRSPNFVVSSLNFNLNLNVFILTKQNNFILLILVNLFPSPSSSHPPKIQSMDHHHHHCFVVVFFYFQMIINFLDSIILFLMYIMDCHCDCDCHYDCLPVWCVCVCLWSVGFCLMCFGCWNNNNGMKRSEV